jgi:hypothetical protein
MGGMVLLNRNTDLFYNFRERFPHARRRLRARLDKQAAHAFGDLLTLFA